MGFALFLFQSLGSALPEVVQMNKADGVRFEEIFRGGRWGGETCVVG